MRFLPLFGALVSLCACSTDVFVSANDGGADADAGATTGSDAIAPDAARPYDVKCFNATCNNQVCCTAASWDLSTCQPTSAENTTGCSHFLACDDSTDCASNEVCCAQPFQTVNALSNAHCATDCAGGIQLCSENSQCASTNCQNYQGAPSWLKSCQ